MLGETLKPSTLTSPICKCYFMTGGPGKEHGTNKQKVKRRQTLAHMSYQHARILLAEIHLG